MSSLFNDMLLKKSNDSSIDVKLKKSILDKITEREKQANMLDSQESDQTIGAETKASRRKPKRSMKDDPARLERTLFVGNVPSKCCIDKSLQRELRNIFSKHGEVESIRFRSLALSEPMPRKVAYISGQLSDKIDSNNAYVVMKSSAEAQKALVENTCLFHGHHLRVDVAGPSGKLPSHKKSVFVGNLPLDVSEEALWTAFSDCGAVTGVRVVRDKKSGIGKGFAYVAFQERSTVKLALMLNSSEIGGRKIRVVKCSKPGEENSSFKKTEKVISHSLKETKKPFSNKLAKGQKPTRPAKQMEKKRHFQK